MTHRRGVALVTALLTTVLVSALLAALFFVVTEETRTGTAIEVRDHALRAAESAIEVALDRLAASPADSSPIGGVGTYSVDAEGAPSVVHITRLDSSLFWVVAVAGVSGNPAAAAARRIGVLAIASRSPSDSITIVRLPERAWSELF